MDQQQKLPDGFCRPALPDVMLFKRGYACFCIYYTKESMQTQDTHEDEVILADKKGRAVNKVLHFYDFSP